MIDGKFWCHPELPISVHRNKDCSFSKTLLNLFCKGSLKNFIFLKTIWRENFQSYKVACKADLRDGSEHKVCEFSFCPISWLYQGHVPPSPRNLNLRHFLVLFLIVKQSLYLIFLDNSLWIHCLPSSSAWITLITASLSRAFPLSGRWKQSLQSHLQKCHQ